MNRVRQALAALLALAALSAAGAVSVKAAAASPEPMLGASVEAAIYADEDRHLTVLNRSNVAAVFTVQTSAAGWEIGPQTLTLDPEQQAAFDISEIGLEPGTAQVRVVSVDPPVPGTQRGELLFETRLFLERPADWRPLVVAGLVLALVAVVAAGAVLRRTRHDRQRRIGVERAEPWFRFLGKEDHDAA